MKNMEQRISDVGNKGRDSIRRNIYDIVSCVIILSVIAASLNAIGFADYSGESGSSIADFILDWVPYFAAAVLLNNNLYGKGAFIGKLQLNYINCKNSYSDLVNKLKGQEIKGLYGFCDKFNDDALKTIQTEILKSEGITYDEFVNGDDDKDLQPLKQLDKKKLLKFYNKEQVKSIFKAKKVKIKKITVNNLLSSIEATDPTDLGPSEKDLAKRQRIVSTLRYILMSIFLSLIAVKDIRDWGWAGIIFVIFKVTWVFAKSYMSYFKAYGDITIDTVNNLNRKSDILKMYLNYIPEQNVENQN